MVSEARLEVYYVERRFITQGAHSRPYPQYSARRHLTVRQDTAIKGEGIEREDVLHLRGFDR
jgi:hypothetical protein